MSESPGEESFTLGTLTLTKGEYANAEKINEIIDYLTEKEKHTVNSEDLR